MEPKTDAEKNIDSLLKLVSDLYERVHRLEKVLIVEGTLESDAPDVSTQLEAAKRYVQETRRCSVSHLQKYFKLDYLQAFALLDALEAAGVIAPYRGEAERVVNQ